MTPTRNGWGPFVVAAGARYGLAMDLNTQLGLVVILNITLGALAVIVGLLLTYLVIRQGVFHGLRAHTRWVDRGKD